MPKAVDLDKGTLDALLNAASESDLNTLTGHFHVANVGDSTAELREVDQLAGVFDKLPMARPYDTGIPGRNPGITLNAGMSHKVILEPFHVSSGDINDFIGQRKNLYVMGLIVYVDPLGNPRQTGFCQKWDRDLKRFKSRGRPRLPLH